jgi:uncharacterized integral membrane protein
MVASAILATIIGTIEYFTLNKITKSEVIEYRSTLKMSAIMFTIGIIAIAIYINIEGIPQMIGW